VDGFDIHGERLRAFTPLPANRWVSGGRYCMEQEYTRERGWYVAVNKDDELIANWNTRWSDKSGDEAELDRLTAKRQVRRFFFSRSPAASANQFPVRSTF
jgi:hypothetical protein